MNFNLMSEMKMPRFLDANILTKPKTNEVKLSENFFKAKRNQSVA